LETSEMVAHFSVTTNVPTAEHQNTILSAMETVYRWESVGSFIPATNCDQSLEWGIPFLQSIEVKKTACKIIKQYCNVPISKLSLRNACCYSVQNVLSSCIPSKILKIKLIELQ
jgi:hypothetical protein